MEYALAHHVCHIFGAHHGLGHAGELGEFIDHPLDVIDLANDRVCALKKIASIILDHEIRICDECVSAGKLDRRQRVFLIS